MAPVFFLNLYIVFKWKPSLLALLLLKYEWWLDYSYTLSLSFKCNFWGLPWWSNGYDLAFKFRVRVQSLVRELRSHMPHSQKTNIKQKQYWNKFDKDLKKWSTLKLFLKKRLKKCNSLERFPLVYLKSLLLLLYPLCFLYSLYQSCKGRATVKPKYEGKVFVPFLCLASKLRSLTSVL